jgi:hypothetical protein
LRVLPLRATRACPRLAYFPGTTQENVPMSREDERTLTTADIARGVDHPANEQRPNDVQAMRAQERPAGQAEPLAALFPPQMADDFRRRWDAIQIGFVDDPRAAVHNADELVAQVLKNLAGSFADQRAEIESRMGQGGQGNTEEMRVALQRYRSFFQRLLTL